MVWTSAHVCGLLEFSVILFQVVGVSALCLYRLLPQTRWADGGRVAFIVAMIGLGIAGASCGRYDSEFALFAGGTMTFLLIAMTVGSGSCDTTVGSRALAGAEATFAG